MNQLGSRQPAAPTETAGGDDDNRLKVDAHAAVAAELTASAAPGAAVAIAVDGRMVVRAGVGHRDLDRTVPLAADARFPVYSIGKLFLAATVLQLEEEGRLELDAPIGTILPAPRLADAVTLRRLLNHTAGLPDYGAMAEYQGDLRADPGSPWTTTAFIERTLSLGEAFPPGRGWAYSNLGYLLMRRAIEHVTTSSLRDALARRLVDPLGLTRTTVAESLADTVHLTPGFSAALDRDGLLHDIVRRYHPGWVAHGLILSTAADLAWALDRHFAGALVGPESLTAMRDGIDIGATHPLISQPAYGLGLMIGSTLSGRVAGHAGGGPGFSTAAFHFPDVAGHRLTCVALANRDQPNLGMRIAFALAATYRACRGTSPPDQTRRKSPG